MVRENAKKLRKITGNRASKPGEQGPPADSLAFEKNIQFKLFL